MEPQYRLPKITAAMMIIVALFLDLFGGVGTKIFHLIGAVAAAFVGWIPIFGSLLGGLAVAAGFLLGETFGWMTMLFAYLTMTVWFAIRRVPILFGKSVTTRATLTFSTLVIEALPLINIMPGFTMWVIGIIAISRMEDRRDAKRASATISRVGRRRRLRRAQERDERTPSAPANEALVTGRMVAANDNRLQYEQAA